jgi:hypothetical protein
VEQLKPLYNKKTGIVYFPFEKKLLKVVKDGIESTVEFMHTLARDRMQIRVSNVKEWNIGEIFTIKGKDIVFTCKVVSVRDNKLVIKKITEEKILNGDLTYEEKEIIKEL